MTVIDEIKEERKRQIEVEGFTAEHDNQYNYQLLYAASCYILTSTVDEIKDKECVGPWPWDWKWWKPTTRRRNLIKAAALIVAHIEKLDRAEKV